jgi:dihydrofolate reductase
MGQIRCHIAISLDGYAAGPDQRPDEPLGTGGEGLHTWMFGDVHPANEQLLAEVQGGIGAYVMGRNMFAGPGPGDWDPGWRGWWGDDPPYHAPVFVVTHHPRDPLPMDGGTTFHFVGDLDEALAAAREAAGERDVLIAGGASTVRQCLDAGVLDEVCLHITPTLLGGGERLLDGVEGVRLEQASVVVAPTVTHVRYRVVR